MQDYLEYQLIKEKEYENICRRCGNCCGAGEDPCEHLIKQVDGKYSCSVYDSRQGIHKTVSGKEFKCVRIRNMLSNIWFDGNKCAYKKEYR